MTSTWTLKENSTGELEVTVEGEAWKKAQKKALNYAKSHMNLKGFRQGQIPDALVKKQLSSKALYDMASEEVANEALSEGIKEHNIDLVARPTLDVKEADDEKAVLVFTCTVLPEVTLGEYKGLDIKKADVEVTEEDVENEVKRVQDRYADWVVREDDDAAQLGDQVVIDFVGTKDGVAFEGGSGENYPLELGSGSFIPGFEEQLVGAKVNDTVEVNVTFPENYGKEELNGKPAKFEVTIKEIKVKELPELDDEFAKEASEFETIADLKADVTKKLEETNIERAEREYEEAVINAVAENAKVEIPAVMVEKEVDKMVQNLEQRLQYQGLTLDQYFQFTGTDEAKMREYMRENAGTKVKVDLVLEAIEKAENIDATEEEIKEKAIEVAKMYSATENDKMVDLLMQSQQAALRADVMRNKTLNLILGK